MSLNIHNSLKKTSIKIDESNIELLAWINEDKCHQALCIRSGDFYWQIKLDESLATNLIDHLHKHIENIKQQHYDLIAFQTKAAA